MMDSDQIPITFTELYGFKYYYFIEISFISI